MLICRKSDHSLPTLQCASKCASNGREARKAQIATKHLGIIMNLLTCWGNTSPDPFQTTPFLVFSALSLSLSPPPSLSCGSALWKTKRHQSFLPNGGRDLKGFTVNTSHSECVVQVCMVPASSLRLNPLDQTHISLCDQVGYCNCKIGDLNSVCSAASCLLPCISASEHTLMSFHWLPKNNGHEGEARVPSVRE